MSQLQNQILTNYKKLFENPTLRIMSKDSGIQVTRLHRILSGSGMKLSEYEIIKNRVFKEKGRSLTSIVEEIDLTNNMGLRQDIEKSLKRKIRYWELMNGKESREWTLNY